MLRFTVSCVVVTVLAGLARAEDDERPWTFLVYGAADNNADGPILRFLDDLRVALDDDPGVELLLLIDRHGRYSDDETVLGEDFDGTRLYRLRKDSAERLSGEGELPQLTLEDDVELDTSDPEVLGQFIAWAKMHHPARRYGLMIYSHANGQSMCPDETSGRDMGIADFAARVDESVDFCGLELCNMAGLEIAYEWRPRAQGFQTDVLVAIPNAGPPLDWDRAFARIRTPGHASRSTSPTFDPASLTAEQLGVLVVEEGKLGREAAGAREPGYVLHECAACFDLRLVEPVKLAVDALARELAGTNARELVFEQRSGGETGDVIQYSHEGPFVDAYDLCARLAAAKAAGDGVRARATEAMAALDAFTLASFGGRAHASFAPGKSGAFLVLPPDEKGIWARCGWYSPKPSVEERTPMGGFAFLRDGGTPGNGKVETWYELLDLWLDAESDANGFRP